MYSVIRQHIFRPVDVDSRLAARNYYDFFILLPIAFAVACIVSHGRYLPDLEENETSLS